MEKHSQLIVIPAKVYINETLTIRWSEKFEHRQYCISDEKGRTIRQGSVSEHISEVKLCMVGLATGEYHITMGQEQVKFIIVH